MFANDIFAGVIWGVKGCCGSVLGLAMLDAARARVWLLSRRRLGASLILGCVWHYIKNQTSVLIPIQSSGSGTGTTKKRWVR